MEQDRAIRELEFLRKQIDKLDSKLIEILSRRKKITTKIGKIKAKLDLPSIDAQREENQFKQLKQKALALDVNPEFAINVLKLIIEETVKNHNLIKEKNDTTIE